MKLTYQQQYYQDHREEKKKQFKERYRRIRGKKPYISPAYNEARSNAISFLGSKCIRCGFEDVRALQIDHVNGNGTEDRARFSNLTHFYRYVVEVKGKGYQLLCANCNRIKVIELGEHRRQGKLG